MRRLDRIFFVVAALILAGVSLTVHSQSRTEDLTPCGKAPPEPAQSGTWAVPFCNRTGHELVVQFHDNDCPADNWSRRGNIYEKQLPPDASVMVPLCYAREAQPSTTPPPGVPQLRLPGGKGVVTTWSIVGDCGARSDRPQLDPRTFYDRGSYETGIVLLQYPASAAHCYGPSAAPSARTPGAAAQMAPGVAAVPATSPHTPVAGASASALSPTQAGASTAATGPAGDAVPVRGAPPVLAATIDPTNRFSRVVHVFATSAPDAPTYHCKFRLALDFSDGSSWVDRQQVDVHGGDGNAPLMTRKYGKTVTKVVVTSPACMPSG
jgi:hypothetical protein